MKRRIRKKKRLGEFAQFGFTVAFRLHDSLSDVACDAVCDRFVSDTIEACDLLCGGGGHRAGWEFFTHAAGRSTTTEHHRAILRAWLVATPEVAEYYIGPLTDAWHGPFGDPSEEPWTRE